MKVGVISDTHGTLSRSALGAMQGVDHILHAGDIGGPDVLNALSQLAPTISVRGNTDGGPWSRVLPPSDVVDLDGKLFYLVHDLYAMDIDPVSIGIAVVITGHTHQPEIRYDQNILYLNPGSASHGRYGSAASIGRIDISHGRIHPRIITLDPSVQ